MTEHRKEIQLRLYEQAPPQANFRQEVLDGLRRSPKELPSKFLYDERGAQLFEAISELEEYYPTRSELAIMNAQVQEMVALAGPGCLLIEYGSGSSRKTRLLLEHLQEPAGYIPIDISRETLLASAAALQTSYPHLEILPVHADYTTDFELPQLRRAAARRVVYFPGSTIGNFHPREAKSFLQHIARLCQPNGGLLIGVDLKKDPTILHRAYNDSLGVTAQFNLNLLARINRELGATFRLDRFAHYAFYSPSHGRVEMHLVSLERQRASIEDVAIGFERGESIWTESSYKYSIEEFAHTAAEVGLTLVQAWTDPLQLFSVQYYELGKRR